jgi:hypothetical protein
MCNIHVDEVQTRIMCNIHVHEELRLWNVGSTDVILLRNFAFR